MSKVFKDYLGKPVEVGDFLFYSVTGTYANATVCKIVGFYPKTPAVVDYDVLTKTPKLQQWGPDKGYPRAYSLRATQYVKVEFDETSETETTD